MKRVSLSILVLVGLFLVVGSIGIGTAIADEHDATESAVDNSTVNESAAGSHDLEVLQSVGRQQSGAPPSVRRYGSAGSLWLRHDETSVFDSLLPSEAFRTYVEPGTTVRRDTVYLGGFRGWDVDSETLTIKTVYWETGTIERETEDGRVVTERAAVNQRTDETVVELGSGYDEAEISLRDHYEESTRVTMWVEGHEGDLQWTFNQKSSRASESFPAGFRGSFVGYGFLMFVVPALLVSIPGFIVGGRVLDRVGAGPGYDPLLYVGVEALVVVLTSMFAWDWIREIFSTAPWLIGILLGLNILVFALEVFGDRSRLALVLQLFDLENTEDGGDGSGTLIFEGREIRIAETENGTVVLKKGLRPFLARAFGAVPYLEAQDGVGKISIKSHASKWSEMFLVAPFADRLLEHSPEHWELDVFDERDETSRLPAWVPTVDGSRVAFALPLLPVGWYLGSTTIASGLIGLTVGFIGAIFLISTPKASNSRIDLAPLHYDDVLAKVIQTTEGLEEEIDRDWYRDRWYKAEGSNLAKRKSEREESEVSRFESVIQELEPDGDEDGSNESRDDLDDRRDRDE